MKRVHRAACVFLIAAGCRLLDPDHQGITTTGKSMRLVADTQEIRDLFDAEEDPDEKVEQFLRERSAQGGDPDWVGDVWAHPDRYAPGRKEFLEAMTHEPGMTIPEKTYCRILVKSKVRCQNDPLTTAVYLKVRITTGPYRGSEGWGCEGSDISYADAFP